MPATVTTALLALSFSLANALDACSSAPYRALSCLVSNTDAASICSDITLTATNDIITAETARATRMIGRNAQPQATGISIDSTTVTVTIAPSTTVYAIVTSTASYSTTITTYMPASTSAVSTSAVPRRTRIRQNGAAAAASASPSISCTPSDALAALEALPVATRGSACSCIGHPVQSNIVARTAIAAPAVSVERVTYTETITLPPRTISVSTLTSVTSTSTVSLAAPTFTQVFGPQAGCVDIGEGPAQQLDLSVTGSNATQECKDLCTQMPACSFVYVQQLAPKWGGKTPHYQCFFNDHHLNATADLDCGRNDSLWGEANGFDAYGRGQPSAGNSSQV